MGACPARRVKRGLCSVASRSGGIEIRLLVLGGGGFLGYHVVAEALRMGHEVSTFSREGEAPLAGVEALEGDRAGRPDGPPAR